MGILVILVLIGKYLISELIFLVEHVIGIKEQSNLERIIKPFNTILDSIDFLSLNPYPVFDYGYGGYYKKK
ncbi:hypothetical protein BpHYR1_039782 [Brachionus plicatilis]|uniref:Uncharacterized protein n=1 Tax=Brachionus plicatilis TaxID=10195 RepID=A0A3M7Q601_BRAPC|nr:hypothetical protein BpHYR1_039782 [Brachionus plicatilis]